MCILPTFNFCKFYCLTVSQREDDGEAQDVEEEEEEEGTDGEECDQGTEKEKSQAYCGH